VKKAFPAKETGRSKGVMVALVQIPCKSGWPSAVRGAVHFFADADDVWASAGGGASDTSTMMAAGSAKFTPLSYHMGNLNTSGLLESFRYNLDR
jgi:hypothetical protein